METLIRQITRTIEENETDDKLAATGKALKEIVFSGLSRSGFFKKYPYLPELDKAADMDLYVSFLNKEPENDIGLSGYFGAVQDELSALGIDAELKKTDFGFKVEAKNEQKELLVCLYIILFSKKIKDSPEKITFVHVPLAYELRYIDNLSDSIRSDLQSKMKSCIKAENKANKKVPKKARNEKKAPQDWIQPSLFDF